MDVTTNVQIPDNADVYFGFALENAFDPISFDYNANFQTLYTYGLPSSNTLDGIVDGELITMSSNPENFLHSFGVTIDNCEYTHSF